VINININIIYIYKYNSAVERRFSRGERLSIMKYKLFCTFFCRCIIKRNTFIMSYKSLVRSHLEYANSLWNPYQKQDIKALEKVQMRATRLVTALRDKPYQERLRTLDLPTL